MLREIVNFVFIYIITFWLLIFCALPIGAKTDENPVQGNDHGAPKNSHIKKKFLYTMLVTLILVSTYTFLNAKGIIDLDHWVNGE